MASPSDAVSAHVSAAAAELFEEARTHGTGTLAEILHALLWPYVADAAKALANGAPASYVIPGAEDKRSKPWQYVVRFWAMLEAGPDLLAETDPAIMTSTGQIPIIIADLSAELYGQAPEALCVENTRPLLPQFRNNLGRGKNATLRIPYEADGDPMMCQMDVFRLDA